MLVFGLKPERLIDSEGRIDAFLEPPTQEQGETLIEAVRSGAGGGRPRDRDRARSGSRATACCACRWSQSALDDERLTIHETPLPPLAGRGARLARVGGRAAPAVDAACSSRCCRSSRPSCTSSRGWAASAASACPTPSLGQHIASLAPGQRVRRLVLSGAVRAQARPRRRRRAAAADRAPDRASRSATTAATSRWIAHRQRARSATSRSGRSSRRPTARRGGAPASWSRASPTRSTCSGSAPSSRRPPDPWTCRWCRELIARSPCPLCGHRGRPPRRPRAAAPAGGCQGDQHGART